MTTAYLLDTNMFSYIAKGVSPAARSEFLRVSRERDAVLCLSVISEAEIRFGMEKHRLSRSRRSAIESLLAHFQILPWGSEEAATYGLVRARLEARGITVESMDRLIAAQAIATGAVLVTRDSIFAQTEEIGATANWASDL